MVMFEDVDEVIFWYYILLKSFSDKIRRDRNRSKQMLWRQTSLEDCSLAYFILGMAFKLTEWTDGRVDGMVALAIDLQLYESVVCFVV